jgi:hypothetical protein
MASSLIWSFEDEEVLKLNPNQFLVYFTIIRIVTKQVNLI